MTNRHRTTPWPHETVCSVCGRRAEVGHPDGTGDQTYYCAEHEPETLLDLIEDDTQEGTTP